MAAASPAPAQDFTYDRGRPPSLTDRDIRVREVSYVDVDGRPTEATLIAPRAPGTWVSQASSRTR